MPKPNYSHYPGNGDNRSQYWRGDILQVVRAYQAAGLSFIPISPTRNKTPYFELLPRVRDPHTHRTRRTWRPFVDRLPTAAEIKLWFDPRHHNYAGLAIVCGAVSGGLEVVDFMSAGHLVSGRALRAVAQAGRGGGLLGFQFAQVQGQSGFVVDLAGARKGPADAASPTVPSGQPPTRSPAWHPP